MLFIGIPAEGKVPAEAISSWAQIDQFVEQTDASMLIIECNNPRHIQHYLNGCRTLRIPYLMVKRYQQVLLGKIGLPVSFLIEEKEKAPFASAFGRFCDSEICIYAPKDYGEGAKENISTMTSLFDTFSLRYEIVQGHANSFGIEREATDRAVYERIGLVLVSASREYGLDDVLFGCKEKKILKKSRVPLLLINPRADLYALCD
jgi:hypothetical protein